MQKARDGIAALQLMSLQVRGVSAHVMGCAMSEVPARGVVNGRGRQLAGLSVLGSL